MMKTALDQASRDGPETLQGETEIFSVRDETIGMSRDGLETFETQKLVAGCL